MKRAFIGMILAGSLVLAVTSMVGAKQTIPLAGINQGNGEYRAEGEGPFVIQFWASWCASCGKIMPQLSEYLDANGKSIPFLAISTDEHFDDALRYVDRLPLTTRTPAVSFFHDYTKQLAAKFEIKSVPTVILVNESGDVVFRQVGHLGGQYSVSL